MAGRGRGVQRLPRRGGRLRRAARLRLRRVRQAAPHREYWEVDAVVITHLHADHILDLVPYASALTYAPRQQPVPVGGHPGTDTPARPRLIAPAGAAEAFRQVCSGSGMRRRARRAGLRADRVRARRHVLARAARALLPAGAALPPHQRRRAARGRLAADLQRRLRAQRRAGRVRAGHVAAADRGHAAAPERSGRARAPHARRRPASTAAGPARAASCSRTSPTSSTPSGRAGRPSALRRPRRRRARGRGLRAVAHSCTAFGASCR